MGIMKIQLMGLSVALPSNRENHELLVPVCKKLAEDPIVKQVYLHHNSIYIDLTTYELQPVCQLVMLFGTELYKAFKKAINPVVTVGNVGVTGIDQANRFESTAAHMIYEEYVETLQTDPTADLFGIDSAIPFDRLPEYFKFGERFKGTHTNRTAPPEEMQTAMNDIVTQFNHIFSAPIYPQSGPPF